MLKALIPMAGEGSRFKEAGYTFPKPLIDINGKSMIEIVIDTLPECDEYIFLCRTEHVKKYALEELLQCITQEKAKIITVDRLTDGAARTALLAKNYINNSCELIIANSDQYCQYSMLNFNLLREHTMADGIIFTFTNTHPKWSYVKVNQHMEVIEVVEKFPISNIATTGIYYFRTGSSFVYAAENMIRKNIRTNEEFYLAPCYNQLVEDNKLILPFEVSKMAGLGTPEDLKEFLKWRLIHEQ